MAEPPLASNNPFRRKSTLPPPSSSFLSSAALSDAAPPTATIAKSSTFPQSPTDTRHHPFAADSGAPGASGTDGTYGLDYQDLAAQPTRLQPTGDEFREQLRALPRSTEAPPSTTFLKPKPVKKVRVQSPPPSSPDSVDADFEARFPSDLSAADPAGVSTGPSVSFGDYGNRGGLLDDRPIRNYDDYSSESDDSDDDDSDDNGDTRPNLRNAPTELGSSAPSSTFSAPAQQGPPPNPFQKTLGDLEPQEKSGEEAQSESPAAAAAGKATLDVDAFRRLLLTGQAGASGAGAPPRTSGAAADAGSITDASTTSKHSVFDAANAVQETPRTSHEISENDDDRSGLIYGAPQTSGPAQRQTLRKKPPPPSSRHGKLIKTQKERGPTKEGEDEPASRTGGGRPTSSSSDVNKPLPPPPARRSADDEDALVSIFDREAAGKLPEVDLDPDVSDDAVPPPRPPTPPNASHSTAFSPSHPISDLGVEALASSISPPVIPQAAATPSQPKKPTPPPPPRRHAHNRSESRSNPQDRPQPQTLLSGDSTAEQQQQQQQHQQRDRSPVGSPRSSLDSTRSWSSSIKLTINAPAPPPPRRATHASRPSTSSFVSPSATSFASVQQSASATSSSPSTASDNDRMPGAWPAGTQPGVTISSAPTPTLLPSTSSTPVPGKLAKPPPPPARNTSVRHKDGRPALSASDSGGSGRPPSVASVDAISRRIVPHAHAPHSHFQPPPPPPRQRGSSRGSMDGPPAATLGASASSTPRKVSSESVRRAGGGGGGHLPLAEEDEEQADDGPSANNILADLDALQREVDALRGQYKKPAGPN